MPFYLRKNARSESAKKIDQDALRAQLPTPPEESEYVVLRADEVFLVGTLDELVEWAATGRLTVAQYVYAPDEARWVRAGEIGALQPAFVACSLSGEVLTTKVSGLPISIQGWFSVMVKVTIAAIPLYIVLALLIVLLRVMFS